MYQRAAELTHRILFRIARDKAVNESRSRIQREVEIESAEDSLE
jgi:hypothetical protein